MFVVHIYGMSLLKIRLLLLKPGLYKINGDTQPNKACNRVSLKCHWSTICFLLLAPLTKSFLPHSRTIPRIFRGGRKKRGAPWHQVPPERPTQPKQEPTHSLNWAKTWAKKTKQTNKGKSLSTEQPNNHADINKGIRQSAFENKVDKLMSLVWKVQSVIAADLRRGILSPSLCKHSIPTVSALQTPTTSS